MDNPAVISDSQITGSSGNPADIRPGNGDRWSPDADDLQPTVTIDLYDGAEVGDVTVEGTNIKTFELFLQFEGDDAPVAYNPEYPDSNLPLVSSIQ